MTSLPFLKRGVRQKILQISRVFWHEVRYRQFGQRWPVLPHTINLLVNDICNSKCQMCLIWRRKQDKEITPQEFSQILQDPLFRKIRYIGVSGGEPTLRADLPEIFAVLAQKQPALRGAGIITNAIQADTVLERILASAERCQQGNLPFNVMVSLDGVGAMHDQVRGRSGNFESAWRVVQYLRSHTAIPVTFGCTITKDNLWQVDELLDFVIAENLYGRFRVAEFIQRLYNEGQGDYIRNFSAEETYHLALFFTRLLQEFETKPRVRETYRNIREMLLGEKRSISCPYQVEAVTLDSRGQLLYCAPKSPVLGDVLETSPRALYFEHIPARQQIIANYCDDCIHDYHAQYPTFAQEWENLKIAWWKRRLTVENTPRLPSGSRKPAQVPARHALIVGWYGTETTGDKAILGELLYRLSKDQVDEITLASLYPFFSQHTVGELGYPGVKVIPAYSGDLLSAARRADLTIMGGGPLMDLRALGIVLHAFLAAHKAGKRTWIAGAGIGPLRQPRYIQAITRLLKLADLVELRDSASVYWAREHHQGGNIRQVNDPAVGFVERFRSENFAPEIKQPSLNCYFRKWTEDYRGQVPVEEFEETRWRFEQSLAHLVRVLCEQYGLRPRLLPMHHFSIGGDDRIFNRTFAQEHLADLDPIVEMRPLSAQEILCSMQTSRLNLTMRFHSTLFAYYLEAPFYAIDYTQGEKVYQFLADRGALHHLFSIDEIIQSRWESKLADIG